MPILQTLLELPLRYKLLAFATLVVLVELGFRRFGRDSQAYRRWTRFFEGIGAVWTVVILGVVYFTSVLLVSLVMRLLRTDLLGLRPAGASAWHSHEPNPLPPERAARHQF